MLFFRSAVKCCPELVREHLHDEKRAFQHLQTRPTALLSPERLPLLTSVATVAAPTLVRRRSVALVAAAELAAAPPSRPTTRLVAPDLAPLIASSATDSADEAGRSTTDARSVSTTMRRTPSGRRVDTAGDADSGAESPGAQRPLMSRHASQALAALRRRRGSVVAFDGGGSSDNEAVSPSVLARRPSRLAARRGSATITRASSLAAASSSGGAGEGSRSAATPALEDVPEAEPRVRRHMVLPSSASGAACMQLFERVRDFEREHDARNSWLETTADSKVAHAVNKFHDVASASRISLPVAVSDEANAVAGSAAAFAAFLRRSGRAGTCERATAAEVASVERLEALRTSTREELCRSVDDATHAAREVIARRTLWREVERLGGRRR
jgi:hypothetical protein